MMFPSFGLNNIAAQRQREAEAAALAYRRLVQVEESGRGTPAHVSLTARLIRSLTQFAGRLIRVEVLR